MKKINLSSITKVLSEKELKKVVGGSGSDCKMGAGYCSGSCGVGLTCAINNPYGTSCGCY